MMQSMVNVSKPLQFPNYETELNQVSQVYEKQSQAKP
jgi:hypothetical protein